MNPNPEKLAATKANYDCLVSKMASLKTKQEEIDLKIQRLQTEKNAIQRKRASLRESGVKIANYLAEHGIETQLHQLMIQNQAQNPKS